MSELSCQSASRLLLGVGWLLAQVMGMNGVPERNGVEPRKATG